VTEPSHGARSIDLNADLGEGVTDDAGLLAVVTSANVACGYHAGDEATMRAVCVEAVRRGVTIGAQVSYDDREHFGRRHLDVDHDVLRDQVAAQVTALSQIAQQTGGVLGYVKPHGALYNRVVHDTDQARAVLAGSGSLPVLGLPGSVLLDLAAASGRSTYQEAFPDRGYTDEATLVPRGEPGSVFDDPEVIAERAVDMARRPGIASVCVHGDSAKAVDSATRVRAALQLAGLMLRSFV